MSQMLEIENVSKTYEDGFKALKSINLNIKKGEIFALLGPNGAGKTTLISIICGIVNKTSGQIRVGGFDNIKDYKKTRSLIGLVPQEITRDAFETVWNTVSFSRGLFGLSRNDKHIEKVLKDLSLWDKKDNKLMTLSGGMKRRVLIAKALAHEPQVLFLDEPTAGVDVELRKSMWDQVRTLRESGVTVILTTHYIEEAEEMADRVGVISNGEIILVERKDELMKKLGRKELVLELSAPMENLPEKLSKIEGLALDEKRTKIIFTYDSREDENGIVSLMNEMANLQIKYNDLYTKQSSLEDIFVNLVGQS